MKNTREVVIHAKPYISGKTLDFGAGRAKYRHIISPSASSYTTFDMIQGDQIDVVGDVLNPPFEDHSFDTVVTTQVMEHVEKPWIMVHEIARITRPGGICIATAPFTQPFHADPNDYFRYTVKGLESLFRNEGFEIIESGSYGRLFSVISEMIHFSLFSPYEARGRTRFAGRAMRIIEKVTSRLDLFVKNRVIYSNSYVIARKK